MEELITFHLKEAEDPENFPVIKIEYADVLGGCLIATAIRFKNSLQENAKIHAMAEDIIEACHNGIVSWEKSSDIKPVLIQGQDDYIKTK